MPRKLDELYGKIATFESLRNAALRAVKGKRKKPGAASFMANLEREILRLERELLAKTYAPGRYKEIAVRDPKPRTVSAAPFRDRVVHHALCDTIQPIFERGFVFDSYANRSGKGTHDAIDRYDSYRKRFGFVLRCDIYRFFPSIDHEVLKRDVRRRIECDDTLWLIDRIIDGSNPQEPVHLYFPGDGLFAPFQRRRGLPIGNLTSQFFANLYLDGMDHFIREVLRAKGYVRYVDDFAIFADEPETLSIWRGRIERYLEARRLRLHPRKTWIASTADPATFLGIVLHADRRMLPEENVRRFRNRLRGMRDRYRAGSIDLADVERRVGSWIAHAEHADTWRLRHAIFEGGVFDPAQEAWPSRVRARPARRVLEQQT